MVNGGELKPGQAKKARARQAIVEAAEARIARHGVRAIKARDIAGDAGVSLGAIYSHFPDLDALILTANLKMLRTLGEVVHDAARKETDPVERLVAAARGYTEVARSRTLAWAGLFEHAMAEGAPIPDWYLEAQAELFRSLGMGPTRDEGAGTGIDEDGARALFSAVHGIVIMSVRFRDVGVAPDALDDVVESTVRALAPALMG